MDEKNLIRVEWGDFDGFQTRLSTSTPFSKRLFIGNIEAFFQNNLKYFFLSQ